MTMTWKKALSTTITTILVLFLIASTALTISSRMHQGVPQFFGHKLFIVLSGSMEPSISTGSVVSIRDNPNTADLKVGQVVTFHSPYQEGAVITHRISEVRKVGAQTEYITKGDSNNAADPMFIVPQDIIGVYDGISIPWLGYFLNFITSKKGLALLVIVPSIGLFIWQTIALWRNMLVLEKEKKLQGTNANA